MINFDVVNSFRALLKKDDDYSNISVEISEGEGEWIRIKLGDGSERTYREVLSKYKYFFENNHYSIESSRYCDGTFSSTFIFDIVKTKINVDERKIEKVVGQIQSRNYTHYLWGTLFIIVFMSYVYYDINKRFQKKAVEDISVVDKQQSTKKENNKTQNPNKNSVSGKTTDKYGGNLDFNVNIPVS